jgi:hypothetical protein
MCDHSNLTVLDGIYVCTGCGHETDKRVYITSHNRSFTYRRPPVYCRQKRFLMFVRSLKQDILFLHENDILTVFGKLEFCFNMGHKFERKYFFNRFVTLAFINSVLGIPLKTKTLKDPVRVQQQLSEMQSILEISLFS